MTALASGAGSVGAAPWTASPQRNRCAVIMRLRRALADTQHWPERDTERMAIRTFAGLAGLLTISEAPVR